ncbi:MAG: LemA family protein [Wenzhouxiangellaceae bacterium]
MYEWVIIAVAVAIGVWAVMTYNRLVQLRNQRDAAWSDIDVQLQRRFDLIPNLLQIVKGYCEHERETLREVAGRWQSTVSDADQRSQQENDLSGAVGRLLAVAEDYPQLWADKQFRDLHQALVTVEDHLQYARRYYNGSVRDLNNLIESFPALLVARPAGFSTARFFALERATQAQAPTINLDDTAA